MFQFLEISSKCVMGCGLTLALLMSVDNATAKGKETVLYSFQGDPSDGAYPHAGLIMDKTGNLYSTRVYGGTQDKGTVFRLAPDGTETVLHSFCSKDDCTDGANPFAGLIMDELGNLYSTTLEGGADNNGTVFKLAPDGTETVLPSFCSKDDCTDGAHPFAGLIMDERGNLYSTTTVGGAERDGTVFELKNRSHATSAENRKSLL